MPIDFAAVKARHPLALVARRTGLDVPDHGDLTVNCPFHKSTGHHSMYLHLGRPAGSDSYLCFAEGCVAHRLTSSGRIVQLDVIQWVRDAEGVNTAQAVAILDSGRLIHAPARPDLDGRTGTPTPAIARSDPPNLDRTRPERALEAMQTAWGYYTYGALHTAALDYLRTRNIDVTALEAEQGYAVAGHTPFRAADQLVERLRRNGFSDDELVDAGLARRRKPHEGQEPRVIDYFRQRVVLPVRDDQGRVIGLVGRYTGDDSNVRRYDNSPRTVLYDKSRDLYRPSTPSLHPEAQVVVVEGTLDALALAAAAARTGRSEMFAPICESGVALSQEQTDRIVGIHPRPPVLAYDGDEAGQAAAARAATAFAQRGRECVVLTLPRSSDGTKHDPASWLAEHGSNGLTAFVRKGCLEPGDHLRPRHGGMLAARQLMEAAGTALEARWRAALAPMRRMEDSAAERYATSVAEAVAPAVVAAAIKASPDDRDRPHRVTQMVCTYGHRLPRAAQERYVEFAVREMAQAGLGADGWLERTLRSCMTTAETIDPPAPARTMGVYR